MQTLRPDQEAVIDGILAALRRVRRVQVQMPTGAGKTTVMAELASRATSKGRTGWFMVHREELASQMRARLEGQGSRVGILMGTAESTDAGAPMQVLGVQTLANRIRSGRLTSAPDFVIADESHHACAPTWKACVDHVLGTNPSSKAVFFSATPWLADGSGLGIADEAVIGLEPLDLVELGVLVRPRIFCGRTPDLRAVGTTAGEFVTTDLVKAMRDLHGDIVKTWRRLADGRRTLMFAASVAHSLELCMRFRADGVRIQHVDAETPELERARAFEMLRDGLLDIVTNVGIVTEGFDCPAVDCVVLARATKSDILYLQMVGRALRSSPGKTEAIIIDHGLNAKRHGHPLARREFVLRGKRERKKVPEEELVSFDINFKLCPACGMACSPSASACDCGAALVAPRIPKERPKLELVEFTELDLAMREPAAIAKRRARWQEIKNSVRGAWPQSYAYAREFGIMPHDDMILFGHERRLYWMDRRKKAAP